MSFIDPSDYAETQEQEAAPEGEYDLRCVKAEAAQAKNSERSIIKTTWTIEGYPDEDYQLVGHTITFPTDEDKSEDLDKWKMMMRSIKRFAAVFGLDPTEVETPEDWAEEIHGTTGSCMVVQNVYEGNIYSNLRLPRAE